MFNFNTTYFRNWRNADRFNPGVTPPRQKFQGFVEFNFNPELAAILHHQDSSILRTQLSSLVLKFLKSLFKQQLKDNTTIVE